jgi:hypothetical protein
VVLLGSPSAPAGRAFFARACHINRKRAALKFFIVKLLDCLIGILRGGEFDECKTSRFPVTLSNIRFTEVTTPACEK